MSSVITSVSSVVDDRDTVLLTLRKPTELKKIIESVPKPAKAVPKNGLPMWYRLGLECKLPVPKIPEGKIVFSRGKVGEDVRRITLTKDQPSFNLEDPYCYNVSYEYVPMHDPHLAHFFQQKQARAFMKRNGYVTEDGRAICSLKEFNQYRKFLYNRFMDRIHVEMMRLNENARDNLVMKRVQGDVARRHIIFRKSERARQHQDRVNTLYASEIAEKKRLALEQEKRVKERIKNLIEYNEKVRKERANKALEKQTRIKQRVKAAAELELRRKIMMLRQWKINERKRLLKAKQEEMARKKKLLDDANDKWAARIQSQNMKLQEEEMLLKIYTEDMSAAAARRAKAAKTQEYRAELELAKIKLANWKLMHGGIAKDKRLVWKMGVEFEKSKRGSKGMSTELAQSLAREHMGSAHSTAGDALTTLGQARIMMDTDVVLPTPPVKILMEAIQSAVMEFARRRVIQLLQDLEMNVRVKAALVFFQNMRPVPGKKRSKQSRWIGVASTSAYNQNFSQGDMRRSSIMFGDVEHIASVEIHTEDMKSSKYRVPTPMPSKTRLAEVTFSDRLEELPDAISIPSCMPERKKLIEMMHVANRILNRLVSNRVIKGLDVITGKVTLPVMRHPVEWGEIVEGMSEAVVNHRVNYDSANVRRASEFVAIRILKSLLAEMKEEKRRKKFKDYISEEEESKEFYNPDKIVEAPLEDAEKSEN